MWKNRNSFNGLSVLPYDGGSYKQAPFEECTKKQYEEFMTNVNKWEDKLINNGLEVVKFYFSIDKLEYESF